MQVIIEIYCDNAAFEDCNCSIEVARILRVLADDVEGDGMFEDMSPNDPRDFNGNKVGTFVTVSDEQQDEDDAIAHSGDPDEEEPEPEPEDDEEELNNDHEWGLGGCCIS